MIPGVTGKYGLGVQNDAGQRLTEFYQENVLVIANTLFQHKRRLYTWTSPDGQYRNQIDSILCSQRWRSSIQSVSVSFWYTAKWISYTYTYIHSYFFDSFPIWVIAEYWVEFPVLYSRSLLVMYFTYSSMYIREGNGIALQYSCLENPMDGGAP